MNQDDIIRMAREAGFDVREGYVAYCYIDALKTFAERVAAAEREKCAAMVDPLDESLAEAIRARGNA